MPLQTMNDSTHIGQEKRTNKLRVVTNSPPITGNRLRDKDYTLAPQLGVTHGYLQIVYCTACERWTIGRTTVFQPASPFHLAAELTQQTSCWKGSAWSEARLLPLRCTNENNL
eukprot:scpid111844/ scgid22321/ 